MVRTRSNIVVSASDTIGSPVQSSSPPRSNKNSLETKTQVQLVQDIERVGGRHKNLEDVYNSRPDTYGVTNSPLRRSVRSKVYQWRSLPESEYQDLKTALLSPPIDAVDVQSEVVQTYHVEDNKDPISMSLVTLSAANRGLVRTHVIEVDTVCPENNFPFVITKLVDVKSPELGLKHEAYSIVFVYGNITDLKNKRYKATLHPPNKVIVQLPLVPAPSGKHGENYFAEQQRIDEANKANPRKKPVYCDKEHDGLKILRNDLKADPSRAVINFVLNFPKDDVLKVDPYSKRCPEMKMQWIPYNYTETIPLGEEERKKRRADFQEVARVVDPISWKIRIEDRRPRVVDDDDDELVEMMSSNLQSCTLNCDESFDVASPLQPTYHEVNVPESALEDHADMLEDYYEPSPQYGFKEELSIEKEDIMCQEMAAMKSDIQRKEKAIQQLEEELAGLVTEKEMYKDVNKEQVKTIEQLQIDAQELCKGHQRSAQQTKHELDKAGSELQLKTKKIADLEASLHLGKEELNSQIGAVKQLEAKYWAAKLTLEQRDEEYTLQKERFEQHHKCLLEEHEASKLEMMEQHKKVLAEHEATKLALLKQNKAALVAEHEASTLTLLEQHKMALAEHDGTKLALLEQQEILTKMVRKLQADLVEKEKAHQLVAAQANEAFHLQAANAHQALCQQAACASAAIQQVQEEAEKVKAKAGEMLSQQAMVIHAKEQELRQTLAQTEQSICVHEEETVQMTRAEVEVTIKRKKRVKVTKDPLPSIVYNLRSNKSAPTTPIRASQSPNSLTIESAPSFPYRRWNSAHVAPLQITQPSTDMADID